MIITKGKDQKKNNSTNEKKTTVKSATRSRTTSSRSVKNTSTTKLQKTATKPRFLELYRKKIAPMIMSEMQYQNVMLIPRITKIVLNMRIGDLLREKNRIQEAREVLSDIAGQYAVIVAAKKSIAAFKVREGMPSAIKVTLRGHKMYYFLDRLINIALPRIRDFYGLKDSSFDRNHNFSMGISEHIIFPEVVYDKVSKVRGFDITICTNASSKDAALLLLSGFNLPFNQRAQQRRQLWPVKD